MSSDPGEVTQLLRRYRAGDTNVADELFARVYDELRRQARRYLAGEAVGHTWQPTELVHEVYLRLIGQRADWRNRAHFFGVAAQLMRRLLVDHARARTRLKRPPRREGVSLDDVQLGSAEALDEVIAVDRALEQLAQISERAARVVELRYFGGLTETQVAEVLGVTRKTVVRDWRTARLWLHKQLT